METKKLIQEILNSDLQAAESQLSSLDSDKIDSMAVESIIDLLEHKVWKIRKLTANLLRDKISVAFPILTQQLKTQRIHIRYWTIQILPAAGKPAARVLIDFFNELSHQEKLFALMALAEIKDPETVGFAQKQLNSDSWAIRNEASNLLYAIHKDSVPSLREAIKSGSDHQRFWSFALLGRIVREKAIPTFRNIIQSSDYSDDIRSYALNGIKEIDSSATIPLLIETLDSEIWSLRAQASKILIQHNHEPHKELAKAGIKGNKTVRYWITQILQQILHEKHLFLFEDWYKSSDEELRFMAISIMSKVLCKASVLGILNGLSDPVWYIRKHAADCLSSMGRFVVRPVTKHMEDAGEEELFWICRTLGHIKDQSSLHGLKKLLNHQKKDVRLHALQAIHKIGGEQAYQLLSEAFENEFWVIRNQASQYLLDSMPDSAICLFESLLSRQESTRFWSLKTIDDSQYFGAHSIAQILLDSPEDEADEIKNCLGRLNAEALEKLLNTANVRKRNIIEATSVLSNLNPASLFDFQIQEPGQVKPSVTFFSPVTPQQEEFEQLLRECISNKATKLHLKIGSMPMARVDGVLCKYGEHPLSEQDIQGFLYPYFPQGGAEEFSKTRTLSFPIPFENSCFRTHLYQQQTGIEAILEYTEKIIPDFESLKLPSDFMQHLAKLPHGLILISGASGSGKSSAAISLLSHINQRFVKSICTVEDHIDLPIQSGKSIVSQKIAGRDIPTFESSVSALAKEDADVVYLSRIPDFPALEQLLHLANSRALVILETTASSTKEAIEKLLFLFPKRHLTIYEKLLQTSLQASLHLKLLNDSEQSGLIPAAEYFLNNSSVSGCLSLTRLSQLKQQLSSSRGEFSITMDDYLLKLVNMNRISYHEALRWLEDKSKLSMDEIW
jgi:twitching motility protein PilT